MQGTPEGKWKQVTIGGECFENQFSSGKLGVS